jgi:integrase
MKAWNLTEMKQLLSVARKDNESFYILLLVSILHGLRVSEAINLRKRNFVLIGGRMKLRVKRLKGSLETDQVLHHDEDDLLDEDFVVRRYISKIGTDDFLFWRDVADRETQQYRQVGRTRRLVTVNDRDVLRFNADRLIKGYCKKAGIDETRAHMHAAKHSLGVMLRKAGRPLEEIAQSLGHKNLNNSRVYLGVTDEDADRAREAAFAAAIKSQASAVSGVGE